MAEPLQQSAVCVCVSSSHLFLTLLQNRVSTQVDSRNRCQLSEAVTRASRGRISEEEPQTQPGPRPLQEGFLPGFEPSSGASERVLDLIRQVQLGPTREMRWTTSSHRRASRRRGKAREVRTASFDNAAVCCRRPTHNILHPSTARRSVLQREGGRLIRDQIFPRKPAVSQNYFRKRPRFRGQEVSVSEGRVHRTRALLSRCWQNQAYLEFEENCLYVF